MGFSPLSLGRKASVGPISYLLDDGPYQGYFIDDPYFTSYPAFHRSREKFSSSSLRMGIMEEGGSSGAPRRIWSFPLLSAKRRRHWGRVCRSSKRPLH